MILNRLLQLPIIFVIGENKLSSMDTILDEHKLNFTKKTLITSQILYDLYPDFCSQFKHIIFAKDSCIVQANEIIDKIDDSDLLIGFGGGVVLDITKYIATKKNINHISIPTALSHDGIYSAIASMKNCDGVRESIPVQIPIGIIIDINVIMKAPVQTLQAGIGDLISNLSSLADWRLGKKHNNEVIDDFAYSLASLSTHSILNHNNIDLKDRSFIKSIAYNLVLSGLAMTIAQSSRPASGAEHMISHALDQMHPKTHKMHGFQVAYATYYLENLRHNKYTKTLEHFFKQIGLPLSIEELGYSQEEFNQALEKAPTIRKRFTIFNTTKKIKLKK